MCTTELGKAAKLAPEFKKRGVKMLGFSIDSVDSHNGWIKVTKKLKIFFIFFRFNIIKSFVILLYYIKACNEFAEPISAPLHLDNTALFEEMV